MKWHKMYCTFHHRVHKFHCMWYYSFCYFYSSFRRLIFFLICNWIVSIKNNIGLSIPWFYLSSIVCFKWIWISCVLLRFFNLSVLLLCVLLLVLLLIQNKIIKWAPVNLRRLWACTYICCLCAYKVRKGDNRKVLIKTREKSSSLQFIIRKRDVDTCTILTHTATRNQ